MSNETPNDHHAKTESAPKHSSRLVPYYAVIVIIGLVFGLYLQLRPAAQSCYRNEKLEIKEIDLGDYKVTAEVASSAADQTQGLSGRDCLIQDAGMLFEYSEERESSRMCFWMKDMKFPIDMIWLDGSKKVVHIEQNVQPDSYPSKTFCPGSPAMYVLELNSGKSSELELSNGSQLSFN